MRNPKELVALWAVGLAFCYALSFIGWILEALFPGSGGGDPVAWISAASVG